MKLRVVQFVIFLLFIGCLEVAAQNLLKNPSFESLNSTDPIIGPSSAANFTRKVPHWGMIGGGPIICTSSYSGELVDTTSFFCADGKLVPYSGKAMVEIQYVPQCISPAMTEQGCSDYLAQKLNEPMLVGKLYELSMMVYIPRTSNPGYAYHIGFQAYTEPLPERKNYLLDGREFLLDTVIFDQWYEASWTIRPSCDLSFIVFGVFRSENGPPIHNRKVIEDTYFIDNLQLVEKDIAAGIREKPFCKTQPRIPGPRVIPGLSLYFNVGQAIVRREDQILLDSLAYAMQRHPRTVFEISGHTDITGDNHMELSTARIDSVLNYLKSMHRINPLRFVRIPFGDQLSSEYGKRQGEQRDRRVDITGVASYPQRVLYRYIVRSVRNGQIGKATKWFYSWLFLASDREVLLVKYDPRLNSLLENPMIRTQYDARKTKMYTLVDRDNGKPFLDSLWHEDQLTRTLGRYIENIFYYVPSLDSSANYWRVTYPKLTPAEYRQRDSVHSVLAIKWLDRYGWPKVSVVGKRAAKAIPLALIHSEDSIAMDRYLPEFYAHCRKGEAEWQYYAFLFDRNRVIRELPQRYGTQYRFDPITLNQEIFPVENWDKMNQLRREIGMREIRFNN